MTVDPEARRRPGPDAVSYDHAATELFRELKRSCDPDLSFAHQIDASLWAALRFLAADRPRAQLLTDPHLTDPDLLTCHGIWTRIYARQLRRAAERSPHSRHPDFVEPFLVTGLASLLRAALRNATDITALRPDLLDFVLCYYSPPPPARPAPPRTLNGDHRPEVPEE